MFYIKNPSELNKPWILSTPGDDKPVSIPLEVTKHLKNYHVMAVEFLYHNYRKGMKGSILNQEPGMNFPLQISAFFSAMVGGAAVVLVICSRQSMRFWHYHLSNHAKFHVVQLTTKNSKDDYKGNNKRLALLIPIDCLNLCEDVLDLDFFSVVIDDFDQIAIKRVVKKLEGKFNVGLTHRSFYMNPNQKLRWNMLNWANPGCVGKIGEFYEIDNRNAQLLVDNYRYWWFRLTWRFCESFKRPTDEETESYEQTVAAWASANALTFAPETEQKSRKRKYVDKLMLVRETETSDNSSREDAVVNEVPIDKYVKLPSMDESPIVTSIIKNFEISPDPIPTRTSLPYTQTQPNCSKFEEESVLFSFIEDGERPSTSKSESEKFILNLFEKGDNDEAKSSDIKEILKKADAVLQN